MPNAVRPPLQYRQLSLRTVFVLLTYLCALFAVTQRLPIPPGFSIYNFLMIVGLAILTLWGAKEFILAVPVESPIPAAWVGTLAGGVICVTGLAELFVRGPVDIFIAAWSGAFIGFLFTLIFSPAGLAFAKVTAWIVGTNSPWVVGPLCGGATGFCAIAYAARLSPREIGPEVMPLAILVCGGAATFTSIVAKRGAELRPARRSQVPTAASPIVMK